MYNIFVAITNDMIHKSFNVLHVLRHFTYLQHFGGNLEFISLPTSDVWGIVVLDKVACYEFILYPEGQYSPMVLD